MSRRGTAILAAATATLLATAVGGVGLIVSSRDAARDAIVDTVRVIPPPFVMFRTLAPRDAHGRVAMVSRVAAPRVRYISPISCARVQYAAGAGLCMMEEPRATGVKNVVYTFDRAFVLGRRIELAGIPIRARVSPDGRLAAITVYAEEESPAGERLASETVLIDMAASRIVADLREFAIESPPDLPVERPIDIASVTFRPDSDRFFATLSTPTARYLVEGSVAQRRLTVVRAGLANEALSADGTQLVAKRQVGERGYWQLIVVDLASGTERALKQGGRSVDDQVEWLDRNHVIYHEVVDSGGTGLWVLAANGTTEPRLLIADAFSPAIQP
jgi:hypothetical protein